MWQKIIPVLSKKHRVITIDLLGHGGTESIDRVHTMEEQAKMVKFVLDSLHLVKYSIVGHSLGGYIALAFAELFPKNIDKMVLMNSTALPDTTEKQKNRDRAITMVNKNKNLFIKMAIPNLFTKESNKKHQKEIQFIKEEALQTTTQGVILSLEGMKIRKDRTAILQDNSIKKLFIIGKKDPLLNYASLIKQTKNSNVKIVEFSNGHMSHIENSDALLMQLSLFL